MGKFKLERWIPARGPLIRLLAGFSAMSHTGAYCMVMPGEEYYMEQLHSDNSCTINPDRLGEITVLPGEWEYVEDNNERI